MAIRKLVAFGACSVHLQHLSKYLPRLVDASRPVIEFRERGNRVLPAEIQFTTGHSLSLTTLYSLPFVSISDLIKRQYVIARVRLPKHYF